MTVTMLSAEKNETVDSQSNSNDEVGWAEIVQLAERAERAHERDGRVAARELVLPSVSYEAVVQAARSGNELTRRKSLGLLHCWNAVAAAQELVRVLRHDSCPVVRHEAAYYLATLRRPETIGALTTALREDPVELVRHEAAEALGDMGAVDAIPALREALNDESQIVVRTVRIALQQLSESQL